MIADPFLGSGTVLVAAALLDRIGYGTELIERALLNSRKDNIVVDLFGARARR